MKERQRIAVIVETSSGYGRQVLEGIGRYVRTHDNWLMVFQQWDLFGEVPAWIKGWKGDGIISRIASAKLLDAMQAADVPFVNLTDRYESSMPSHVRSDDVAIGREAARHLRERGFCRFGYCGFSGEHWSQRRETGFSECIESAGFSCEFFNSPWIGNALLDWEDEQKQLGQWLASLTPPVGIMACNDVRARQLLDACISQGLSVPEEVALIGADNDELLCQFCAPPLTSVIPNASAVGYHAASVLAQMMRKEGHADTIIVPPIGIAVRQSTDIVAIDNHEVARAIQFIRENACHGICVEDVAKSVPTSRGTLERRFRKYIQRTPQQEIRRVQVARVCDLLTKTDLTTEKIAVMSGFENPEYMYVVFKRLMEVTPGEFRRATQFGPSR
ncbi:MAG: DNA-binding transcriptional regulator [Planctomycetota bacterium]